MTAFRFSAALFAAMLAASDARPGRSVPFQAGEKIAHRIRFGFITGGSAEQEIAGVEEIRGRRAYHIISRARSSKGVGVFHKIRELRESWMDEETLTSLRLTENVRSGSYRKTSVTEVDPETGRLTHSYETTKSSGNREAQTPIPVQDSVSVVYFMRTREDLAVGQEYEIPLHSGGKIQTIKVRVTGVEKARVPAGEFDCFHIKPVLEAPKDDDKKKLRLEVWLTQDERRIPVLIKSELSVGSFTAEMTEYSPGPGG